jgi:UDP-perosamine 4-acetyltransferase
MDSIVVVGGGGHAKVLIGILRKLKRHNILGYTDPRDNGTLHGAPYLGTDLELTALAARHGKLNAVLALGQVGLGKARCELWSRLPLSVLLFPPIVSPGAIVNEEALLGEGAVVMDGAVINIDVRVGRGVIVNTNSTIEHDAVLSDWVHVSPGATICGGATVGSHSMIGAGATVIEGITIADCCMVGAGATVVHDLSKEGVYVGSPARRIK